MGALGVHLSPPFLAAQALFAEWQRRGMLICLCSRNEEADVRAVLRERAAELLLREATYEAYLAQLQQAPRRRGAQARGS